MRDDICHIRKKELSDEKFIYVVRYPLGLYPLYFCCEEHRDEYIKKHTAEFYCGVPIYQQFNFDGGRTAYMIDYFSGYYSHNIQDIRKFIDDMLEEEEGIYKIWWY